MQIAVLASAILAFTLVMLLFRKNAEQAARMERRIRGVAKLGTASTEDANELNRPFNERFLRPAAQGVIKWLSGLMPKTENPKLAGTLRTAGSTLKTVEYNAIRLVSACSGGVVGLIVAILLRKLLALLLPPLFVAGVLVMMRYMLASKMKARKVAIQRQLPEVLDLLSVSVEAGLGFDAALQRISERAKGPLIDELNATWREIMLGRSRAEALRNFEARCGLEEVKSFVSSIIQAEQLGISLKNVLKSQAQQMRLLKRQRVEERAMKAPVKIILPLVAFVFPVLFIILLGPAVVSIIGMKGLF